MQTWQQPKQTPVHVTNPVITNQVPERMFNHITKQQRTTQTGTITQQREILTPTPDQKEPRQEIIPAMPTITEADKQYTQVQEAVSIIITAMGTKLMFRKPGNKFN